MQTRRNKAAYKIFFMIKRACRTDFSVIEAIQKIADIDASNTEKKEEQIAEIKSRIFERHNTMAVMQKDVKEILQTVEAIVDSVNTKSIEKEKLLKRITYRKIEIVIESVVAQEGRRREGLLRSKQEAAKSIEEMNREIVRIAGKVLNIAKRRSEYCPFVISIVSKLMVLAAMFDMFVPVSYYLLYMMSRAAQINAVSVPLAAVKEDSVKVQDKYVCSKVYKEYVMGSCLDLLVTDLKMYSTSLAFPEYSSYAMGELRSIRTSPNKNSAWISTKMQGIIKSVKEHTEMITEMRSKISVMNEEAVQKIESTVPILKIEVE